MIAGREAVLPRIRPEELEELACEHGFGISPDELPEYLALTELVLGVLDGLDGPDPRTPAVDAVAPARRDLGRQPGPGEDPYNAVVRWCLVESEPEGPLSGLSVACKDSISIAGVPMTCGSRILESYVPARDSVVVERILGAGGRIVAITNMDDLAFSGGGDTSCYGPTLCPFDQTRTAGGSSSGSAAALWYEGVDLSVGTDQGGSIRVPAAWCGALGLKPTHGLVPYTGLAGIDQTFDHAGPMARTVEGLAALLSVIAGKHPSDPRQREVPASDYRLAVAQAPDELGGIRIGVVAEGFGAEVGCDDRVGIAVREATERLRALGAELVELSLPEHVRCGDIAFAGFVEGMTALLAGGGNGYHWAGRYAPDLALALRDGLTHRAGALPPQLKLVLAVGTHLRRRYRGAVYARAQNLRPWLRAAHDRALADVDVLLLPTTPGLPHPVAPELGLADRVGRGWAVLANTYPTDMTGHPALTVPAADVDGLPVGVMLVGRHFDDARLLALARSYEQHYGWLPARSPAPAVTVPATDRRVMGDR